MKLLVDPHCHTIASGHAYSTISENAAAAARAGISLLGITEHAPAMPDSTTLSYFFNLDAVPRELYGVELLLGAELNIVDYEGGVDLPEKFLDYLDIGIASLHPPCLPFGTREQNTAALIGAMALPRVNIIGHPGDPRYPLDIPAVVDQAIKTKTLLEINNVSLMPEGFRKGSREGITEMLRICEKRSYPVILGSDAHFFTHIGGFGNCIRLLKELSFPEELVINRFPAEFKAFIAQK